MQQIKLLYGVNKKLKNCLDLNSNTGLNYVAPLDVIVDFGLTHSDYGFKNDYFFAVDVQTSKGETPLIFGGTYEKQKKKMQNLYELLITEQPS